MTGSQINLPIAVLVWLMIIPMMMMKVDVAAVRNVRKRPAGLFATLLVSWLVKPFSMALIASMFFQTPVLSMDQHGGSRSLYRRCDHSHGPSYGKAVATAIALFGAGSGVALATIVGVLVEVPVMLSVCSLCNRTRHWFRKESQS